MRRTRSEEAGVVAAEAPQLIELDHDGSGAGDEQGRAHDPPSSDLPPALPPPPGVPLPGRLSYRLSRQLSEGGSSAGGRGSNASSPHSHQRRAASDLGDRRVIEELSARISMGDATLTERSV